MMGKAMENFFGSAVRRSRRGAVAAIAGLFFATGGASAQEAGIPDPSGTIPNFDTEHIGPVLTDLGVVWRERRSEAGVRYIEASVGTNFAFKIVPAACMNAIRRTGCIGANFIALYAAPSINYQTVAAFNQKYAFTTAGVLPGGRDAYVSRYEIADYGIARGNIASSVGSFVYLADRFRSEIASGHKTVSAEGYAGDMSARLLNARAAGALGGGQDAVVSRATLHQRAFERTTEFVSAMNADGRALKNKIDNLATDR